MAQTEIKKQNTSGKNPTVVIYLSDFIKGFKKIWWLCVILAVVLGSVRFVVGINSYKPYYTVSSTLTVSTQNSSVAINGITSYSYKYDTSTAERLSLTFPCILSSRLLQDDICDDLNITDMPVTLSVHTVSGNMFTITAVGEEPQLTYDVLVSAIENYPSVAKYVLGDIKLDTITTPAVPTKPSNNPGYVENAIEGAVIGVLLGMGMVLLYVLMRKTIRTKKDIPNQLNVEAIGIVPKVSFKKHKRKVDNSVLVTNANAGNAFMESVRVLRNVVSHSIVKTDKVIMATSTAPGEGKTTVITNLALSMASYGKKVLLVDGDLRNPSVAELLGYNQDEIDYTTITDKYMIAGLEKYNISFMTFAESGKKQPRFMNSGDFAEVFDAVRDEYDYIFVDTPPCGLVSDTMYIAQVSDAVIYVIRQDAVRISKIRGGLSNLMATNVKIIGSVLNGAEYGFSGYGYNYVYGYGKYGKYGKYGYGEKK